MIKPARLIAAVSFACAAGVSTSALAQTTTPTPSAAPAASATTAPPSDPCGSIMSIVNRPTIGTGVCPVQTGHFDIETGYTNTDTTGPGGNVTGNYPQGLIRIGTADTHLDFEVGTPSFNTSNAGGAVTSGWSDLSIGAKYEIGYTSKWVYGVNGVFTVPTGKPAFSAGNAQFTGNFNWGYTVNSGFGLSGTLGFNALSAYNAGGQLIVLRVYSNAGSDGRASRRALGTVRRIRVFLASRSQPRQQELPGFWLYPRFRPARPVRRRIRLLADGDQRPETALHRCGPFVYELSRLRDVRSTTRVAVSAAARSVANATANVASTIAARNGMPAGNAIARASDKAPRTPATRTTSSHARG